MNCCSPSDVEQLYNKNDMKLIDDQLLNGLAVEAKNTHLCKPGILGLKNQVDWYVSHKIISIVVFWTFMPMFL